MPIQLGMFGSAAPGRRRRDPRLEESVRDIYRNRDRMPTDPFQNWGYDPNRYIDLASYEEPQGGRPFEPQGEPAPASMPRRGVKGVMLDEQGMPAADQGPGASSGRSTPPLGMFGSSAPKPKSAWSDIKDMPFTFLLEGTEGVQKRRGAADAEAMLNSMDLDPRERLAFEANPEKWGENVASNYAAANVGAGDSRFVNGKLVTAPKFGFENGYGYTQTPEGFEIGGRIGPSYSDETQAGTLAENARHNRATEAIDRAKPQGGAQNWRPATENDVLTYNLPDRGYLVSNTGDVKQITDSRKAGQVPASVQLLEQRYLDDQDKETARLSDLFSKYARFNELAKGYTAQGAGPFQDIGQALSWKTSTLKSITSDLIGKMRSPGEGVMTDADAKRLENATVSVNQTPEGNKLAEEVVGAALARQQQHAIFLRQWVADNGAGSTNTAKLIWSKYAKEFPIYDYRTGDPTEGSPDPYAWAMQSGAGNRTGYGQEASSKEPVRVTSKEQRDSLPMGTHYIAPDGSVRVR